MTDLDLDALLDRRHDFDIGSRHAAIGTPGCRISRETLDALIQRLREAEADCAGLEADVRAEFSEYLGNANARIAQLEAELLNQQQLATDWQQRIVQLERVREAAIDVQRIAIMAGLNSSQLNVALAAVEEK